jgi:DNA polymerase-3 subunit epsilon/ATP-dependent DNA helicase DinG
VLKGRANYLCLRRWQTLLHATDLLPEERSLLIKTLFWLPRTRTGDRAELRLTPAEEQAWQRLSALAEACTPQRCPYHRIGVCFLARARRAAEESHIVIANHALLLSDLVTRSRVLPEYQVLVVDEAHHLEDEATQQLGWRLTERELLNRLERLWSPGVGHHGTGAVAEALALIAAADGLRVPSDLLGELEHGERAVTDLGAGIRRFFEGLAELLGDADVQGGGDETTLRLSHAVRAGSRWQELEAVWADASQQLEVVERVVGSLEDRLHGLADSPEGAAKALAAELGSQLDTWRDVRRRLGAAVHAPDTGTVYWLASSPRQRSAWLSAAPLDVAALLRDKLFAAPEATVLVSATLAIGGSFDYVKRRLGLEEARSSGLGSPFDYRRNALLYVPNDLPDPTQAGHQAVLERVLLDTVTRVGGRTLVLFTSRAHLRSTYTALREPLANLGITLLGQGINEGSRTRLLDTFRRGSRVVLFGTNAFWEGIDIVGEALSLVVMVRLPFAVPTDPVYTARAEQFDEPFSQYALPQAVLRLKQGFGRLIRSRSDRGAVVVLDRRLVTRSYGSIFVRSLPPCSVKQGPARRTTVEVGEWLNEPLAQQLRLD